MDVRELLQRNTASPPPRRSPPTPHSHSARASPAANVLVQLSSTRISPPLHTIEPQRPQSHHNSHHNSPRHKEPSPPSPTTTTAPSTQITISGPEPAPQTQTLVIPTPAPPKSSKKLKINTEGNSSGEEGKKKRNRAALSCIQCKTRKVKCDRNSVAGCSNCVRRGEECQWSAGRRASESHGTPSHRTKSLKSASRPSTSSGPNIAPHHTVMGSTSAATTATANYNLSSLSHPIYRFATAEQYAPPASAAAPPQQFASAASYPLGVPIPYSHQLSFASQPPSLVEPAAVPKTTEEELKLILHRLSYLENVVLGGTTRPSTATSLPGHLLPPLISTATHPAPSATVGSLTTANTKSRAGRSESSASSSSSHSDNNVLHRNGQGKRNDQTPPSSSGTYDGFSHWPSNGQQGASGKSLLGLKKKEEVSKNANGMLDVLDLMSGMDRERDLKEALSCLPPRHLCDELVDNYLQKLEWISKPLHVPSFKAQYTQFFAQINANSSAEVDPAWLSLLLMILCLSTRFFGSGLGTGRADVKPTAEPNSKLLFKMAYRLLSCSGALTSGTVESLQAIVLMNVWLEDQGIHEMKRVLISTALRALQLRKVQPTAPFLQVELLRRLHWTLMTEDYQDSLETQTYSIPADQNRYSIPWNLEDEDLGERNANQKSPEKPTVMSYHLSKISFAQVVRRATDLHNLSQRESQSSESELPYEHVIEVTKELREAYERIPSFLRPDISTIDHSPSLRHLTWSRIMIGFLFHSTMLALHFPSIISGFCTPMKRQSVEISIFSAKTVILLMRHCEEIGFPVLNWGKIEKWVWKAGVTLCLDLFHIPVSGIVGEDERIRRDVADRREMISLAIEFLRRRESSTTADRLVELLTRDEAVRFSHSHSHANQSPPVPQPPQHLVQRPPRANGRPRRWERMSSPLRRRGLSLLG
ncbi:hypothetical protein BT69DRAFT_1354194 [Atractiella rhizophila]|nr:hypothetical protein BT69DRAFT_1354194 [Atractiella rhizophila]